MFFFSYEVTFGKDGVHVRIIDPLILIATSYASSKSSLISSGLKVSHRICSFICCLWRYICWLNICNDICLVQFDLVSWFMNSSYKFLGHSFLLPWLLFYGINFQYTTTLTILSISKVAGRVPRQYKHLICGFAFSRVGWVK